MEGKTTSGEACRKAGLSGNLHREVQLGGQESAEAIVPAQDIQCREGLNTRKGM